MVLESLVTPNLARHHPLRLFFVGILFASFASFFSLWIFYPQASLVMVFLTVVIATPLMYATLSDEEIIDFSDATEGSILRQHASAIWFLTFLFMGFVIGFSLWYLFLPAEHVAILFGSQLDTVAAINSHVTFTGQTVSSATALGTFLAILFNNVKDFIFCLFFAFFFGAGSLFILVWNASVISAAIGTYFRQLLEYSALEVGLLAFANYFHLYSISVLRFMVHGVFEIVAYFIGGLAGGIISLALVQKGVHAPRFRKVIFDSLSLVAIALFLLVVGAGGEVFLTPLFFR